MRGFFVTFEGGEGAGKSTQMRRLAERLRGDGFDVATTREPGGSPGAEALRHVLLSGAARRFGDPNLEPVLFAAARADHIRETIRPALEAEKVVLCDRFLDSSRVYQGGDSDRDALVDVLERATLDGLMPDLTVVIDLPAREGLARAERRRDEREPADRFEADDEASHEARRQRFLRIAAAEPQRCVIVDGMREAEIVSREIAFVVEDRLDARRLEGGRIARRLPGSQ